jgi:uncharacterized protein (TIGR04255 family)
MGLKVPLTSQKGDQMTDSLGAWSNAPLAYALAEVRTERLADINTFQPKLAGRFRDEYPLQRIMNTVKLLVTGSQVVIEPDQDTAWEFATTDNRTAVILRPNGLVLHATDYVGGSGPFLARLHRAVNVFAEEVPSVYINRLGLRFIDFVLPREGEVPEDYVDRRLNPDLKLAHQAECNMATSLAIYRMKSGQQLTLRYSRAFGKPEMPPDLGSLSLDPSHHMKPGRVKGDQPTAVLDTDCHRTFVPVERLDPAGVQKEFASIYEISFDTFMTAITDHAKKVWGATT